MNNWKKNIKLISFMRTLELVLDKDKQKQENWDYIYKNIVAVFFQRKIGMLNRLKKIKIIYN